MIERKQTPKLRFPKHIDEWKQYKLGEIGTTYTGLSGKTKDDFGHGDGKYITYMNVFSNPIISLNGTEAIEIDSKQYNVKKGDIFFTTSSETPEEVGMSSILVEEMENTYLNSFCFGFRPIQEFNNYYLAYLLRSRNVRKQIILLAQGVSRYNISKTKMMEIDISIPDITEQQKIGNLFFNLDNLITLHQRKCDDFKELKKGMLQKMFPKKGKKVPEVRFPGFTGDWEQHKLGDALETVTDYVAAGSFADLAKNVEYKDSPDYAQLIRTMDLKNGFTSSQEVYVDKKAFDYLYRVNMDKECIILPNIGNCGEVYYVKPENLPYEHNVLGPNAIFVRSDTNANNFLSILFQSKDFQAKLKLIISPNGQTKFNKTELKGIELILPSKLEEQTKIGDYFANLDNLIILHQRKCDEYKELKKGLLQQMFV